MKCKKFIILCNNDMNHNNNESKGYKTLLKKKL